MVVWAAWEAHKPLGREVIVSAQVAATESHTWLVLLVIAKRVLVAERVWFENNPPKFSFVDEPLVEGPVVFRVGLE